MLLPSMEQGDCTVKALSGSSFSQELILQSISLFHIHPYSLVLVYELQTYG